jgi:hypothetical protein
MTPEEWLQRTLQAANDLAFAYACTPDDRVEASLVKVAEGVRKAWRRAFAFLPAADVDGMVVDLVERFKRRRRQIEERRNGWNGVN